MVSSKMSKKMVLIESSSFYFVLRAFIIRVGAHVAAFIHWSAEPLQDHHSQYLGVHKLRHQSWKYQKYKHTYRLSPKSPRPGMIYAFSLRPLSIQPVIFVSLVNASVHAEKIREHTTRSAGNLVQNASKPSGAAISKGRQYTRNASEKGGYQVYEDDALFGNAMFFKNFNGFHG